MKCSECKTENGYIRMNTNEWVCRKCGRITKIDRSKKDIISQIEDDQNDSLV